VSGYGQDNWAIHVRSLAEAKIVPLTCVQTGSGAHPASYPMDTRGPFPRGKGQPGRDAENSPHLVPRSLISMSYTSSLCTYIGVLWDCFTFTNVIEEHNASTLMVNFKIQHSAKTLKTAIYTCLSLIVLIIYYEYTKLFLKATS
jgi:hypothetical protein